jgi:hypothetical protein
VFAPPIPDPTAPSKGTSIEVPYRRAAFRPPVGEAFEFGGRDDASIDAMFLEAAKTLPKRLLGVIRPIILESYTLRLTHHRLGEVLLEYRCSRWTVTRGLMSFGRHCRVTSTGEAITHPKS